MQPTLSILVCALKERDSSRLSQEFLSQAERFPGLVEILVESDDGQLSSGIKRQRLLEQARGEYVCYFDDDDWPAEDYLQQILEGCFQCVDVVTFNLMMTFRKGGRRIKNSETWRFGLHQNNRRLGKMSANHLCAWKRDIARRVAWCPVLGYADDQVWYQPLVAGRFAQREHHIDKILYHYRYDPGVTSNQKRNRIAFAKKYVGEGLRCFLVEGEILIETGPPHPGADVIQVRDSRNVVGQLRPTECECFHIIKIA